MDRVWLVRMEMKILIALSMRAGFLIPVCVSFVDGCENETDL